MAVTPLTPMQRCVLSTVADGPRTAGELCDLADLTVTDTNTALRELYRMALIQMDSAGDWVVTARGLDALDAFEESWQEPLDSRLVGSTLAVLGWLAAVLWLSHAGRDDWAYALAALGLVLVLLVGLGVMALALMSALDNQTTQPGGD